MSRILLRTALGFLAALAALPSSAAIAPINPIAGDASFVATFGRSPSPADNEDLRIATHLEYVLRVLGSCDVSALPPALQAARRGHLERLREYVLRGEFPRNYDRAERAPCFIDRDGRICAVGYLIEQSAGRALAEAINVRYQYAPLPKIAGESAVRAWIAASGFTVRELGMIQPFYEPMFECLRFMGHSYSNGASPPDSIWLVAKVDPSSPMFVANGLEGELTLVMGPMILGSEAWSYTGGKFELWTDPTANSIFLPDPPNTLVPSWFQDGKLFASRTVLFPNYIMIYPPTTTGAGWFEAWIDPYDVELWPFTHGFMWLRGTLSHSTVAGYDLDWEGTLRAGCDLTAVEASTWGQIKSQYR
jgi:hypothetical protein